MLFFEIELYGESQGYYSTIKSLAKAVRKLREQFPNDADDIEIYLNEPDTNYGINIQTDLIK